MLAHPSLWQVGCDGHETCGHFSRPSTFLLCHSLFGADSALESAPFLDNAASLHRPMRARSSSRFLTRMRFGLRSVGARAVRTVEGICAARARLECPWFGVRAFNNTGNWSPALLNTYAGCVVSYRHRIPNRPADSGHFENSNTSGKPGRRGQAPPSEGSCV